MSKLNTIKDCFSINFETKTNINYNSTTYKFDNTPFTIKRVFFISNVPLGKVRGGHAHKECKQIIIAICGSFKVTIKDGSNFECFDLSSPYCGLYIPAGIWTIISNFSTDAICLVLASHRYEENDYLRTYNKFINYKL